MTLKVGGIVLCGGESRRMGTPKAWLPFGDEFMLQRVVRTMGEVVTPIVVVAAQDQAVPPLPSDVVIVRDRRKARGPMEGLAAGLRHMAQCGLDGAYVSSTDVPLLVPGFVRRLIDLLGDSLIAVPHVHNLYHPMSAVYRSSVLPEIEWLLDRDCLRPLFLIEKLPTRLVSEAELMAADPDLRSLRNLNTPEDYERALGLLNGNGVGTHRLAHDF